MKDLLRVRGNQCQIPVAALLCVAALTTGLLAVPVGFLSRKNMLAVLYGLMCLFFVGYTCYPIMQTLTSGFYPRYVMEMFSFRAMFVVVMFLQKKICKLKSRWSYPFIGFGLLVCMASLLLPFILPFGSLILMNAYSNTVNAYKWITAGFLTVTAVWGVWKNIVRAKQLLYGILVFDCALVMDRLLPLYEPIVTDWFAELAGFALILAVGIVAGKEVAAEYTRSAVMEERANSMERLFEMQRTYYPLLQEKIEEAKAARHDLRHHFVAISGFIESGQLARLKEYVTEYGAAIREVEPVSYSENDVANVLAHHYVRFAKKHGIDLKLKLDIGGQTKVTDADLCGLISNLLENAVESCMRQSTGGRFITFSAGHKNTDLAFYMENSGDAVKKNAARFLSSKERGRKGYGLDSIRTVACRYNGEAEFHYDEQRRVFVSTVLLSALERPEQMKYLREIT